jgi:hypothetical protein
VLSPNTSVQPTHDSSFFHFLTTLFLEIPPVAAHSSWSSSSLFCLPSSFFHSIPFQLYLPAAVWSCQNTRLKYVHSLSKPTSWNRLLFEKLIVAQVGKKFSAFVVPQCSSPCQEKPATRLCPKQDESRPHIYSPFFKISFNIVPIMYLSLSNPDEYFVHICN